VSFDPSASSVAAYDFVEVTITVANPDSGNPFTVATVKGSFEAANSGTQWRLDGLCDSLDGSPYRIRFTPPTPGEYKNAITYRQEPFRKQYAGTFHVTDVTAGGRFALTRNIDSISFGRAPASITFSVSTTAYWLTGWKQERIIRNSIDRLHQLKVNRIRVTGAGRSNLYFGEPVMTGDNYSNLPMPWPAERPDDFAHPGFDYTRFYIPFWQKFERMLRYARDQDMIVPVVFDMNDNKVHPDEDDAASTH
jgi:hypothetical protein